MAVKNATLTISLTAWDTANSEPKTGDAANISAFVSKDGAAEASATNSVSELDATNCPGEYTLALTAAEMNADFVLVTATTTTADIVIYPVKIVTEQGLLPANQPTVDASGHTEAIDTDGTSFNDFDPTSDTVDVGKLSGSVVQQTGGHIHAYDDAGNALPAKTDVTGLNDPSAATIADTVWDEATADHIDVGSTGEAVGHLDADISTRSSHDDPDPSGYIDAAITSRSSHSAADVWSAGTRTLTAFGFTADANVTQILGSALSEAVGGQVAGGFSNWFDVATPANTINSAPLGTAMRGTDNASTHDDPAPDIAALNDLSAADVDAEVDEAIENYGLDHLVSAAAVGTDITNDSIIAQLVSATATADWDDYDNTTDSLQAVRDRGDSAWVTATGFSTHDDPDPNGYISNLNGHTAQSGDTYAALPTNFSDLSITVTDGYVTAGTVNDKTGYSISGAKTTLDDLNDIDGSSVTLADGAHGGASATITLSDYSDFQATGFMPDSEDGASFTAIPWNASWDSEVQSEVNDGLVALHLDHLVAASVTGTDVTDDSIIAQLVSNQATADWDDFDNTADSLSALRDRGDSAWITATGFSTHGDPDPNGYIDAAISSRSDFDEATDTVTLGDGAHGGALASLTLSDYSDFQATGFSTHSPAAVWSVGTRVLTANTNLNDPSAASIADSVWDEAIADHTSVGTTGESLDNAGSGASASTIADAVWDEATDDHVGAGSTGEAVNHLDADISSRSSHGDPDPNGYIANLNGHTPQTGDTYAQLPTNFSDLSITVTNGRVDVASIEGVDATDQIRDALVDDATRFSGADIDAAVSSRSSHDDPGPDIAALNDLSAADVGAEVDEAIEAYGLDHLVMTAVTGTDVTDDSIIAQIVSASVSADWDDFVNTTDSLQAVRDRGDSAWITATGFSTHGDPTSGLQTYGDANWATATGFMPSTEDGSSFTSIPWNAAWDSEVESEVTDGLEAMHLDHLFAVDYDPATPPGTATAWANEMVESDTGVTRFTANALEESPSGGGATAQEVWEYASRELTGFGFGVTLADGAHGGVSATIVLSDYTDFVGGTTNLTVENTDLTVEDA